VIRISIFLIVSAWIIHFSRTYLLNPKSHGFYRLFAFESILLLILLNIEFWFKDPFSYLQIASWTALCLSLYFVFQGFRLLRSVGKPEGHFENTSNLVTVGVYKYIRHPLYSSLLLLSLGAFLKDTSLVTATLFITASIALFWTARMEEIENLEKFGKEYDDYMKKTWMFLPFL